LGQWSYFHHWKRLLEVETSGFHSGARRWASASWSGVIRLKPFYSEIGRPSVDRERMIRMLIVGYCFGIRAERRLCEEVHLNLAYRWLCRLGLDGEVPDHSTFSKCPSSK
jgi:hypothetical protein